VKLAQVEKEVKISREEEEKVNPDQVGALAKHDELFTHPDSDSSAIESSN
jgi:hypothetical protein